MEEEPAPVVTDDTPVPPLLSVESDAPVSMSPEMPLPPDMAAALEPLGQPEPPSLLESDPDFSPDAVWFPDGELPSQPEPPPEDLATAYDSILGPLPAPLESSWEASSPEPDVEDPLQSYFSPSNADEQDDGIMLDSANLHDEQPSQAHDVSAMPPPAPASEHFGSWNVPLDEEPVETHHGSDGDAEDDEEVPVYSLETPSPAVSDLLTDPGMLPVAMMPDTPMPSPEIADEPETVAWAAEEPSSSLPDMQPPPEADVAASVASFELGNLEIVSVCPLEGDKRLLLVQSNGVFALMGQVGAQNPDVSVIKIFENNPIAYQKTFTAIQEGQTGNQGMYLAQVGTWHGVISTFQQGILLHTELG